MCGLGGDLFTLIHLADQNRVEALNATGRAPAMASIDFFRDQGLEAMPEDGLRSATVPGAVDGWEVMLSRFGTMTLDRLATKAIDFAEYGFPVYEELRQAIIEKRDLLAGSADAAAIFLPNGQPPRLGQRLRQPDLAESIKLVASQGRSVFYQGRLGRALVDFSEQSGGWFTEQDLARHTGNWCEPIRTQYRDYEICTQPPNSQGIALLMQAGILEKFDLAGLPPFSADLVHLMVEARKLAFADRDRYVCDPDFHPIPVDRMLSNDHAQDQALRIDSRKAAGKVDARSFTKGGEDTVYLAVVDREGNAISMIQSIFQAFGSGLIIPGTGIMLHNRGCGFSLDPDHLNRLAPHKRPYHTLHPAMILKDGQPQIVLGSPGADGQTQTVIQLAVNMLEYGASAQEAVEAPRWRGNPDGTLLMENRFPSETIAGLKDRGHKVEVLSDWHPIMGSAQAIMIDRTHQVLMGGADPRRQAYAIGA